MATSGTIDGNNVDGPNRVQLTWILTGQSVADNTSTISWSLRWVFSGSVTCRDLDNGQAVINGVTVYNVSNVHDYNGGHSHGTFQVASGTLVIPHNSDGTKSFSASCRMTGWFQALSQGSGSWELPTIPREPGAPGTPTFTNLTPTSVTVSWTAPSNVGSGLTQRNIEIATDSGFNNKIVNHTASWGTSYQATGLSKGTQYWVRVRAASAAGWGQYSAVSTFTTPATVPGAPPQPSVSSVGMTSATVSWSAPSDTGGSAITGYDVQRATDSGFSTNVVTVSDNASPNVLTSLTPNTPYWVRVRAKNAQGAGAWSASRQFTTSTNVYAANGSTYVPITVLAGNGSTYVPITIGLGNGSTYV